MREWNNDKPIPPARAAPGANRIRMCAGGRTVRHAWQPGWQEPCPEIGAVRVMVDEGGGVWTAYVFCLPHLEMMEETGVL